MKFSRLSLSLVCAWLLVLGSTTAYAQHKAPRKFVPRDTRAHTEQTREVRDVELRDMVERVKPKCYNGDGRSCLAVGLYYQRFNPSQAHHWFDLACEYGQASACTEADSEENF